MYMIPPPLPPFPGAPPSSSAPPSPPAPPKYNRATAESPTNLPANPLLCDPQLTPAVPSVP